MMWKAVLLACVIGSETDCLELHDQYGPYKTQEQCVKRIYEMGPLVHKHMPPYVPVSYKCIPLPNGRLT